jgi:hypothetical protein
MQIMTTGQTELDLRGERPTTNRLSHSTGYDTRHFQWPTNQKTLLVTFDHVHYFNLFNDVVWTV